MESYIIVLIKYASFKSKYVYCTTFIPRVGMKFWKVGSRKLYAIKKQKKGKKRARPESDSSSGSEDDISSKLTNIEQQVNKILDVSTKLNFPIGYASLLSESFLCKICCSIIVPPAIFGRCCRTIIGCQSCVDRWYRGDGGLEKKCPLCRGDRGFADTCKVSGLDDFLLATDKMLSAHKFVPSPPPSMGDLSDY